MVYSAFPISYFVYRTCFRHWLDGVEGRVALAVGRARPHLGVGRLLRVGPRCRRHRLLRLLRPGVQGIHTHKVTERKLWFMITYLP